MLPGRGTHVNWSVMDQFNELSLVHRQVSTHGYSQNQIIVWQYPSFEQVAKLVGHSSRVLYLATSPDGESIVTGAGDETLRFWHVFAKHQTPRERSALNFFTAIR